VRTAGGHRRFDPVELARFLRARGGAAATADAADGADADAVAAWVERLVAGDRPEVDAALLGARARRGAWHLVADELGPVLEEIGRRWERGEISVADEHVASECLTRALARVGDAMPLPRGGPRGLLACVEGDDHALGLALAELCLREAGWQPVWLGRRTPTAEIVRIVGSGGAGGADLVALSASESAADADLLAGVARLVGSACEARGIPLVLGGRGAWPAEPGAARRISSFSDFHAFVASQRPRG
jgi:cobalamin-dependent methionine synthase I